MTWTKIGYFLKDHWKGIAAFLAGVIFVIALVWLFSRDVGKSETEEQLESNIDQQIGVNAAVENRRAQEQIKVNNAEENRKSAVNDYHDAVNRPSNQYDGNRASERFCARFPNDPSCRPG